MTTPFLVHHDLVRAPGAEPERWMLVLHGILGSGSNLRSVAKRLAAACPSWGFVLVDLRAHGQSAGAPPPHSVLAAAEDLVRLEGALEMPVRGVVGHSFGGKVALALAGLHADGLEQVWVLDAQPGARPEELQTERTAAVVRMLEDMPEVLPSRERFVEIVEERGHDRTFAAWLAMNLRRDEGGGFRLRVDMTAIRALFESYYTTDLWPVVERRAERGHLGFVIGGKSPVLDEADRGRLAAIAARSPRLHVHTLPDAGHWVHVDDPEGVIRILSDALCAAPACE